MLPADGGGAGGGGISSAEPAALVAYAEAGQRIDAELEATSTRLGAALASFEATCREYCEDLGSFALSVAHATSQSDLDDAAKKLADAISIAGIDGAMALLFHKAGEQLPKRVPSVAANLVTPEGFVVRVPTEAIDPRGVSRATGSEPPPTERPGGGSGAGAGLPPRDAQLLGMAGETDSTLTGKTAHKNWSDAQRASGNFDELGGPIDDLTGHPIQVPRRVDLQTGEPQPNTTRQVSKPDAVHYAEGRIVELKPLGRPIAKDRQEIIRFIRAFEQREGRLPSTIEIQYYDGSGHVVSSRTFTPADFLPPVPAAAPVSDVAP